MNKSKNQLNNMSNLSISKWAAEETPIYRAENHGLQTLTIPELFSIIIGSGSEEHNAVELMREVLADNDNSLNVLQKKDVPSLMQYKGIGMSKATKIMSAMELGRRMACEEVSSVTEFKSALSVFRYMQPRIGNMTHEEFWIIYMNHNQRLIKTLKLSVGGLTEVCADLRIIIREAVLCNSTCLFICHNHPSGSLRPSKYDDQLTQDVKKACDTMRIRLLDHLIITSSDYYSYHEQGKLY